MVGFGNTEAGVTNEQQIAKLEARFLALLVSLEFHIDTLARFGELGIRTFNALHTIADDRKDLRTFCKDDLGLDKAQGTPHTLEQGKIISAWETSAERIDVDTTREAQRVAANLPPQITDEDLILLKGRFGKDFNRKKEIPKSECPSRPYLEMKIGLMDSLWHPERLTEVTSLAQAKRHALSNANTKTFGLDETSCGFKMVTKPFGVNMPRNSEDLRARLKPVRNTFLFLRLKNPSKGVLATCTKQVWDDYIEWLFGPEVWGFTSTGEDGKPMSCPHIGIVMDFDYKCRESLAKRMAAGTDIEAAFEEIMGDEKLMLKLFTTQFTTQVNTPACKALSAPAFREVHGTGGQAAPSGQKRTAEDAFDGPKSGRAEKRAKAKAKNNDAQLALSQGGGGRGGGKGAGKKKRQQLAILDAGQQTGAGKGAGKTGKGNKTTPPPENKPICFAYNNGTACKNGANYTFAHVCQICFAADHTKQNCPQNA